MYARGGYYACVQDAQGEPNPPVVVRVEVAGSRVKFTIRTHVAQEDGKPGPDEVTSYVGSVSKLGLTLSVEGVPKSTRVLKRRSSYWQ